MTAPDPVSQPEDQGLAAANLEAALILLGALVESGLRHLVLAPGSRSGPLASAAGLLQRRGALALSLIHI